jgi:hypothetical protein
LIEELDRTEEEEDNLLNELLEDAEVEAPQLVGEFDLTSLFSSHDEALQFFQQLPMHILNLWANNDKVIHIISPEGSSASVRSVVENSNIPGLQAELVEVYEKLKSSIQYTEHPEEKGIRVITLKQAINTQELLSVHYWANDPKVELYDVLRKRNLLVQPTMEELRMLVLFDTLLEIREAASNRILVPGGRLPNMVR